MTFYFFVEKFKKLTFYRILGIGILVCLGLLLFICLMFQQTSQEKFEVSEPLVEKILPEVEQSLQPSLVYVDIKGEVNVPGVYEMSANSRIKEVVEKAGGFTSEADLQKINLAQKVSDQLLIIVPSKSKENQVDTVESPSTIEHKIHINTASIEELQQLKGVGRKKAELMIQYRKDHGLFQTKEELLNVRGIGAKILEDNQDRIVIP